MISILMLQLIVLLKIGFAIWTQSKRNIQTKQTKSEFCIILLNNTR